MTNILSIKGGGIRGIIPAAALIEAEKQLGKPVREIFEFIGGTSTGALQTAAFAAGVPAVDVLNFYVQKGPEIFCPNSTLERDSCMVIRGRQFDNQVLYDVMAEALGDAKAWAINDSPVKVMMTVGDQLGIPWYFVKDGPWNAKTTGKFKLLDAAVASACATAYFDPWLIPGWGYGTDGGTVGLSDPVLETCVEAFTSTDCYGEISPHEARVISLGTGYYQPPAMPQPPGSLLERISWVVGSLVGSSQSIAERSVRREWPGVVQAFDAAIPADYDEADVAAIPELIKVAQAAAAKMDWQKILGL